MKRALFVLLVGLATCTSLRADESPKPGAVNLSPREAEKAMTVPDGFRVTLFAGEPDIRQPNTFCIDDRGRLWIGENYTYSKHGWNPDDRDRILIFEDTDNDGRFDRRKVFFDDFHYISGIEIGFGGVWIGSPPNLLFLPDRNRDDVPDGEPVVVLDGWGRHDHHETLNSFEWGPDGWLYGCHGVSTRSLVGRPGDSPEKRVPINAGVWRYHPVKERFEVFAWGTNNPWGVGFDEHGQILVSACHIGHLFHIVQGARNRRVTGSHFSPHIYRDIQQVGDHRHIGHDGRPGGGAHGGVIVYRGDSFPPEYRGRVLMGNVHHHNVYVDSVERRGSGFVGRHVGDLLVANDPWFLGFNFRTGPDGSVYVLDWYDERACHGQTPAGKETGRVYKIAYGPGRPAPTAVDRLPSVELARLQLSKNDWFVCHARRILAERAHAGDDLTATHAVLRGILDEHAEVSRKLRALWTLHVSGGADRLLLLGLLDHASEYLRAWAIQLLLEDRVATPELVRKLEQLAREDPSPVVRLYLASALQRLDASDRWGIAAELVRHGEDETDHNLPLMYWFGIEPILTSNVDRALDLATDSKLGLLRQFVARRLTYEKGALGRVVERLEHVGDPVRLDFLRGMHEGLAGRRDAEAPAAWHRVSGTFIQSDHAELRRAAQAVAVAFGDARAVAALRELLLAPDEADAVKEDALAALLARPPTQLAPLLHELVSRNVLRESALRGLASVPSDRTPAMLIEKYSDFRPAEKRIAIRTLSSRVEFAMALLDAVEKNSVPRQDLSADVARQIERLGDSHLIYELTRVWGSIRATAPERQKRIASLKAKLGGAELRQASLESGRAIFEKNCSQCHRLFGKGGQAGPDLTGTNRAHLDFVLENTVDPNATVSIDYRLATAVKKDGQVVSGVLRSETPDSIALETTDGRSTILRSEILKFEISELSMMPEGLLDALSFEQIRDLVAYLAIPAETQ